MRPSRRLLIIALAALAGSVLAVAAGGVLRDLAWAPWLILAIAILIDVVQSRVSSVDVACEAPQQVFVGQEQVMTLLVTPPVASAPAAVGVRVAWPPGLAGDEEVALEPTDDGAVGRLSFKARRRGTWRLERAWLMWSSRWRLIEFTPRVALGFDIAAVPDIRPVQSGVIDVKVKSTLFGTKENLAIGEGAEFHQLRDFVSGMDVRTIDWKRSARNQKLVAKELRAERNHHVIIALDNGHLMMEEVGGLPKIDHSVNAALALAWAAGLGGDLVGLFAYDSQPSLFLPPAPGRRAFARLRAHTAELEYRAVESNLTLALSTLHAQTPRRSLIVIFTDFVDSTTAELMVENVGVMARRHVVVFVALNDPEVQATAAASPDSLDDAARSVSAGQMLSERQIVLERLQRLGVRVVDVPPGVLTPRLVSTYLELKAREAL